MAESKLISRKSCLFSILVLGLYCTQLPQPIRSRIVVKKICIPTGFQCQHQPMSTSFLFHALAYVFIIFNYLLASYLLFVLTIQFMPLIIMNLFLHIQQGCDKFGQLADACRITLLRHEPICFAVSGKKQLVVNLTDCNP